MTYKEVSMEPKTNTKLLTAIRDKGIRQNEFAEAVNEHPTFISRVVNGWVNLDKKRKYKFAKALDKEVNDLFPEQT